MASQSHSGGIQSKSCYWIVRHNLLTEDFPLRAGVTSFLWEYNGVQKAGGK